MKICLLQILYQKKDKYYSSKKTNITSTASINCHGKKVGDCSTVGDFVYSSISDHIIIDKYYIWYHYVKQKGIIQNGKQWV